MSIQHIVSVLGHRANGRWVIDPLDTGRNKPVRLLLLSLANHCNEDGVAYPAVSTLCAETQMSERTVQRAIVDAVAMGLIESVRNGAHGSGRVQYRTDRRPNLYRLLWLERGATTDTPRSDGVPLMVERGATSGGNGVPLVAPDPLQEPSENHQPPPKPFRPEWLNASRQHLRRHG